MRRLSAIAVLGALWLPSTPAPAAAQETAPEGDYPTRVWTELPPTAVSETSYRSGFGTGVAANGDVVELRPGSPFVRIGKRLVQLANPPYLAAGRLRVPVELLERPEFDRRGASSSSSGSAGSSGGTSSASSGDQVVPRVVEGESTRRPGPWRVVIDPGHGGRHPGTVSPRSGTQEKHLTLAISRMIYEELRDVESIDPWLTRTGDEFIDVPDRPLMAVEREGDMFVSIHVDAQPGGKTSARGFTTYFLGASRTEEGRQRAIRENTVPGAEDREGPDIDQLEFILAGLDQGTHLQESVRFGGFVQNELRRVVDSTDRGVRPGPYWVLMRATSNMPTVLVELGFITNAEDERRLRDPQHQRTVAKAVATAIRRYLDEKRERLNALLGGR
ncbi:MAG TPA: N-acetylmuramoyl-L-alanine amidase [Gemmatimonadota bacterium]|nr:N-acetylmuramoyl-L-alanine amidase [Gemmatimonadota bacterium]